MAEGRGDLLSAGGILSIIVGALCALLPIDILGILAVIFVGLAKGEFE